MLLTVGVSIRSGLGSGTAVLVTGAGAKCGFIPLLAVSSKDDGQYSGDDTE